MQAEFSGTCEDNYLEIRLGQWNGKVVKKFCSGDSSGSVSTNSNGVYVKWVKKGDTNHCYLLPQDCNGDSLGQFKWNLQF